MDTNKAASPARRIWLLLGGLGGLTAIIGLVIGLSQIWQASSMQKAEDRTQATIIAILNAQLGVQQEIATLQVSNVKTGPTATAIAAQVAELQATNAALEADRLRAEKAATAAPHATSDAPHSPATALRAESQVPGVSAELIAFGRFENTVTARMRLVNTSEQDAVMFVTPGSYVLNEADQAKYAVGEQSNPGSTIVPAGGSVEMWAKYPLPDDARPAHLTLALGHGLLFERLKP
ncbi:MAG: hypothetical protein GX552_01270 [Chloroflexi bacterium]|nr:hypothetical protein [Chloroflexota bacterium]